MIAALVMLAAAGMVLQAGSVPHLHKGTEAGVYNAEHDLTLLAGLAGQSLLADTGPILAPDAVATSLLPLVPEHPATRLADSGDSRAPPAV